MKKHVTLGIILLFIIPAFGQVNMFLDFSGAFPPAGWTFSDAANWSQVNTREATGIRPECRLHYDPIFSDTARLVSPTLDLTGIDSLHVIFLYSMASKGWGCTVGVASRSKLSMRPANCSAGMSVLAPEPISKEEVFGARSGLSIYVSSTRSHIRKFSCVYRHCNGSWYFHNVKGDIEIRTLMGIITPDWRILCYSQQATFLSLNHLKTKSFPQNGSP